MTLFDRRPGSDAPLTPGVLMRVCCDLHALGYDGPCNINGEHVEGTSVVVTSTEAFTEMTGGLNLFNLQTGR